MMPDLTKEELDEYNQRMREVNPEHINATRLNFYPGTDVETANPLNPWRSEAYDPTSEYRRKVLDTLIQVGIDMYKNPPEGDGRPPRSAVPEIDVRDL
jgi:hypothetical protein